ncbi:MAG: hypothetical protein D6790_11685 [Caldilineae bacterium]|nr:MAG: hypothetical protein D6790_11685 [Caldilineae bacterium]
MHTDLHGSEGADGFPSSRRCTDSRHPRPTFSSAEGGKMSSTKHIWIVCLANVCRSPMAGALLQQKIERAGLQAAVHVHTAGILATPGQPLDPQVAHLLAREHLPIPPDSQTAARLRQADIAAADMILVLEEAQRRSIFNRSPENLHKVFLLSEMIGEHFDIADPYGQAPAAYENTFRQLQDIIERGWPNICRRLSLSCASAPHDAPGKG